ncbi:MAG TPA: tRNA (guanosine(37)-N1)-methyltransferase TrmD [Candidatus Moranbacteria bacterium]|nr:tRNA (guanosine(37)-N1)-methyltransferase TrmD [Candidatus Moranbacteria bacterium]
MTFHLITIFPEIFDSYLKEGILRRAQLKEKVVFKVYDLRDFTADKHRTVDDTPYGGGPGMVLKIEPIYKCLEEIKKEIKRDNSKAKIKILLTSAKGSQFNQAKAEEWKKLTDLIIICGRYEGVDERVAQKLVDQEISVGQYVLTGGELPALIIVDVVTRLVPDVLGNEESLSCESHSSEATSDYPVYTKPEVFNNWKVPKVLLSGNHGKISQWRKEQRRDI